MVRITTRLATAIEPEENEKYKILSVESIKTDAQNYSGLRVELESLKESDDSEYATMLWDAENASLMSKRGSFMQAFIEFYKGDPDKAYETNNWIGHIIKINTWKEKRRDVTVIE